MEQFYQALKTGSSKDKALRQAKRSLFSQSSHELAHPFYWASYLPYGDMSPLEVGGRWSQWWWCLGVIGLFFLVLLIKGRKRISKQTLK